MPKEDLFARRLKPDKVDAVLMFSGRVFQILHAIFLIWYFLQIVDNGLKTNLIPGKCNIYDKKQNLSVVVEKGKQPGAIKTSCLPWVYGLPRTLSFSQPISFRAKNYAIYGEHIFSYKQQSHTVGGHHIVY